MVGAVALGAALSACTSSPGRTTTPTTVPVTVFGQPAPTGTAQLEGVSCATALVCWAVGTAPPTGDGATAQPGAGTIAVDQTSDGGLTWIRHLVAVPDPVELDGISCASRLTCMAVGAVVSSSQQSGAVLATVNGGKSWQPVQPPAGSVDVVGVQCFTADQCVVLATDGASYWTASTVDGGQVWQRGGSLPSGFGGASSLSCPTTQTCMVAGYTAASPGKGAGAIVVSVDAGNDWTSAPLPAGVGLMHAVTCNGTGRCVAVGTTSTAATDVTQGRGVMVMSADMGQTWTGSPAPPGVNDAFGVSCPAALVCAAVGTVWAPTNPPTPIGGVVTSRDGGGTWRTPRAQYIPVGLVSVSCPTAVGCVAVGNDVTARILLPSPQPPPKSRR